MSVGTYNCVQLRWLDRRDAQKPSANSTRRSETRLENVPPRTGAAVGLVAMLGFAKDHFRTSRCHSPMRLPSEMGDGTLYIVALSYGGESSFLLLVVNSSLLDNWATHP
jgi:hypothetical protein